MLSGADASPAVVSALLAVLVCLWLWSGARHGFDEWRWWQAAAFLAGCAAIGVALLSPLESLGRRDSLTAHVGQHLILGDAAAPLLLTGLPPEARAWLRTRLDGLRDAAGAAARLLSLLLSPAGGLVAWALAAYVWYTPPVHRLAVPAGPVHVLDHLSFLLFGMLVWVGAIDPRRPRTLRLGLREGGMPWWARHAYAMGSRAAMLPPALVVWFGSGYHVAADPPLGYTVAQDQANAAALLIGFEMGLFVLAFVVAFVILATAEGERLAAEAEARAPRRDD